MFRIGFIIAILLLSGRVSAHQMTPTYPKLEPSFMDGVLRTKMSLFNKRDDVRFYEINVFDVNWNPLEFATTERVLQVNYLQTKNFEVYIRVADKDKVTYICTRSKLQSRGAAVPLVSSRICSKIK